MLPRRLWGAIIAAALVCALCAATADAQEQTDRSQGNSAKNSVTVDEVAEAIASYVQKDMDLKGGYFMVYDDVDDKALLLRLDDVHRDRLGNFGDDTYFCSADFTDPAGTAYVLDIFMRGESASELKPTQISIYEKDGVPRYTWTEEDGIWRMKPV